MQRGCTLACDSPSYDPWCLVIDPGCKEDEGGGWAYCEVTNPGCSNACYDSDGEDQSNNGACDDGGPGSDNDDCDYGNLHAG